jgi:CRP-like cAMP-binding protein
VDNHELIRAVPLLAGLDLRVAEALISMMSIRRLERGDVLFREQERGDRFYIILSGKLKLGRAAVDGRENLLALLGPGEMVGELTVFDPGPRNATAVAVSDCEVAALAHSDLVAWIDENPQVSMTLLAALARRLRRTDDSLSSMVFTDVPGRVAKALLDLAKRFGKTCGSELHVAHDLTQEELAQLVGASRETVNKALADFTGRGWIRLEVRSVVLLDVERLERRAH